MAQGEEMTVTMSRRRMMEVRWSWIKYRFKDEGFRALSPVRFYQRQCARENYQIALVKATAELGREATWGDMYARSLGYPSAYDPEFLYRFNHLMEKQGLRD